MSYQDKIRARKRNLFRQKQQVNRLFAQRMQTGEYTAAQAATQAYTPEEIAGLMGYRAPQTATISDGQTLEQIAAANNTTVIDVLNANPELKNLQTGMVINVPGSPEWRDKNISGGLGLPSNAAYGDTATNRGRNGFDAPKRRGMYEGSQPGQTAALYGAAGTAAITTAAKKMSESRKKNLSLHGWVNEIAPGVVPGIYAGQNAATYGTGSTQLPALLSGTWTAATGRQPAGAFTGMAGTANRHVAFGAMQSPTFRADLNEKLTEAKKAYQFLEHEMSRQLIGSYSQPGQRSMNTPGTPSTTLPTTYPGGLRRWVTQEMAQINTPGYIPNSMTLKVLQNMGIIKKSTPPPVYGGGGWHNGKRRSGGGNRPPATGTAPAPIERLPAFSSGISARGLVNWRI